LTHQLAVEELSFDASPVRIDLYLPQSVSTTSE
jgi:hypothetical protein